MIEEHLDVSWWNYPPLFPVIGKVANVVCRDDARNPLGKFTLYDVEVFQQRPSTIHLLDGVPYIGQSAGSTSESEDPLLVGQLVIVLYLEGDVNRPAIIGPYFDQRHATAVAQTTAQHPRVKHKRNGADLEIEKTGAIVLSLAEDQSIKIKDSAGNVLLEILKVGGSYEVHLGGDAGLEKLMTEAMITAFNTHKHTGVTTGVGTSAVPDTLLAVGTHTTTITKAK